MKAFIRKVYYWLPAILFMLLIFYLSSRPASGIIKSLPILLGLKIVHMVEYGMLFYLIRMAAVNTTILKPHEVFIFCLMLTFLYGLTDELHQAFVPYRSASLIDALANAVGAAITQLGISLKRA